MRWLFKTSYRKMRLLKLKRIGKPLHTLLSTVLGCAFCQVEKVGVCVCCVISTEKD